MDDTPAQVSTLSGRFLEKFEKRGPWNHTPHAALATAMPCNATTNKKDQSTPLAPLQDRQNPETNRCDEKPSSDDKTSSPPQGKKKGGRGGGSRPLVLDVLGLAVAFQPPPAASTHDLSYHLINTRRRRAGRISCVSIRWI